jgi:hypothetical protein
MFCYIYADFFGLFVKARLAGMNAGIMNPIGPASEQVLLGTSVMMAIPSLMVFLPLPMRPAFNHWVNAVLGLVYAGIIGLTMIGAPLFYLFFGTVEVVLSSVIVWYAWKVAESRDRLSSLNVCFRAIADIRLP